MREILFRGKDFNGKWRFGYLVESEKDQYKCFIVSLANWDETEEGWDFIETDIHHVISETVGQYTGLKDRNGKMIFEGDLIKWFVNNKSSIGYVYFESGWFDLRGENGSICWDPIRGDSEIIGNIHDQKEDV